MLPAARIAEFALLSWALIIVPGGQLGECVQVAAVAFGIGATLALTGRKD
ncbi:MAG TPA: hypothetical protein VHU92_13265 [Streptosporangiaceae bacterium]|jgi:hypothetical protein|nr:hypothetical protein [Streptosporangiaceae bacterium]